MANLLDNLKSQLSHLRHKKDKDKDQDKEFDEITDSLNTDPSSDGDQNPDMQDEMPDDTGEIDYSDDESDKEKARGVKKNTVMLGVGAVGVCLVAAVVASALTPPTKQQDPPINSAQLANTKTQSNKDPAKGIPDKYSDISKYSASGSKANEANGQKKTQDNIKPKTSANATGNANGNTSSVYAANYTGNRNNGSSNSNSGSSYSGGYDGGSYAAPAASYQPSAEDKKAQEEADRIQEAEDKAMQSAISFAVKVGQGATGGSGASGNGAVAMSASSTGNQVVTTSYSLTDGTQEGLSYALQAGSVIQATLITGITTDVDGSNVVAQVRQNIYDSQTGEHLLIPQGSRIIGQAKAAGGRGNARVEVAFTRLIYPDGHDIALPKEKAIDGVGYNGLRDKYTEHSGKLYGTAFVTALLSAAAQSATGNTSGTDDRSPGQEAVSGAVADVLDSMKSVIDRQSNVKPTATIRPGTEFSVFITQDLFLAEYEE